MDSTARRAVCVELRELPEPPRDCSETPVPLSDETMEKRRDAVLAAMGRRGIDALVVYADLEHGGNFEYLVGFLPRFEEALLVLHADGSAHLVLGNENLGKVDKARIAAEPVHAPHFSLPNQPMGSAPPFREILARTGIAGARVGVVGWKLFTSGTEDNARIYDIPAYVYQALVDLCGEGSLSNETSLFIGPDGVRRTCNANELAHYEFAAALASDCVLDAMNSLGPGVTEMEVADRLVRLGQPQSVVTICAFGPRFVKANMYPTAKRLEVGESVSLTVGYRGGLSSRSGYAVRSSAELPVGCGGYLDDLAAPYFSALVAWLEGARVGMTGGELWQLVEDVLPRERFGWSLCPGHLTAEEEWLCSPVYEGSAEPLLSGMLIQTDIIPALPGYAGVSAESTCALADAGLRASVAAKYPELWRRIERRRAYVRDVLGIQLPDDVLPMCGTLAYLRPYLLSRRALAVSR